MTVAIAAVRGALWPELTGVWSGLRSFGWRGWLFAALGGLATLIILGVPSDIIANPFFIRPIPLRVQDYAIWVATAVLGSLIAGTFAVAKQDDSEGKALTGGLLSFVAVGCPVCNKFVIALIGTSGALTFFAPAQLYIGLVSLGLLAWTLRLRMRAIAGPCPIPTSGRGPKERPSALGG